MATSNRIIVTGAAGFIGYSICSRLLKEGLRVVGVDNIDSYYSTKLKKARLKKLRESENFTANFTDLKNRNKTIALFKKYKSEYVIHLAAQAGVRESLKNPLKYIDNNITAFGNVIEACRQNKTKAFLYASSSSVYGEGESGPLSENAETSKPISVYAATKKSDELIAHAYSEAFGLRTLGMRFFTVYGPWGRPDMAYFHFTQRILQGKQITLFNKGQMLRDFTYIDDVSESMYRLLLAEGLMDSAHQSAHQHAGGASIYNIGNESPISLRHFVSAIESATGKRAKIVYAARGKGDVKNTHASSKHLRETVKFSPNTPIEEGIAKFVAWFREFHQTP